jgi:hypothetical protein
MLNLLRPKPVTPAAGRTLESPPLRSEKSAMFTLTKVHAHRRLCCEPKHRDSPS